MNHVEGSILCRDGDFNLNTRLKGDGSLEPIQQIK